MASEAGDRVAEIYSQIKVGSNVLLMSEKGLDKSNVLAELCQQLTAQQQTYYCVSADPGLPPFGAPGALNVASWHGNCWQLQALEPLCTLDAVRFRLPLVMALQRLLARLPPAPLIVDAPAVLTGVAAAELLLALLSAARIDTVLILQRRPGPVPLAEILYASGVRTLSCLSSDVGKALTRMDRTRQRTCLWRYYLAGSGMVTMALASLELFGLVPPVAEQQQWLGRQVAVGSDGGPCTMGYIRGFDGKSLELELATVSNPGRQLLLRDAGFVDGLLRTCRRSSSSQGGQAKGLREPVGRPVFTKRDKTCRPVVLRIKPGTATLVNGVFGDPLLLLQLQHQRRSLLFDLGDAGRLAARTVHQVSDIFISHCHADHIGGFMWFLRSRIGEFPPCRCYGPAGLAKQLTGMVQGILWDRVEQRAPRFEVREWHGDHIRCYRIVAGSVHGEWIHSLPLEDGVIWREPGFTVRATELDHRTPVLAYAFEPSMQLRVCRDRLQTAGLRNGQWLQQLKNLVQAEQWQTLIQLPSGREESVQQLADELLQLQAGQKLVYATDFADTASNRKKLVALAEGAHALFCEATFTIADATQARRTQHLTTTACGTIATRAGVKYLLPFHFSSRYERQAGQLYAELRAACGQTVVPKGLV